ncbi:MAG: LuxR C-terminal-related transcriptional regulator, partial [Cyclobacteriaceae bacterium]|nr:LuxR C-terminal-related transcriptional regulator [Cyclobacteriaceae bacterium]
RKAYQVVKGSGMKFETINSTYVLSEVFKARGKFDSAYYYSDIYHHNKDSLFNKENQRKLSTLYAEIETLSKQKEIETLERQGEIDAIHNRNLVLIIVLGSIAFLSLLISIILFYRNSQKKQKLSNLLLQQELDKRNKDLHDQALKMIYMNNSFMEIEESLKRLHFQSTDSAKDVRQLLSNLQLNKTIEKEWDNFNRYFGTVHGNFFDKINAEFPDLSTSEKRLASLIRMNLTNREIASILNIESSSVKIAKYRLKKKLNLDEETDIHSFFQSLG